MLRHTAFVILLLAAGYSQAQELRIFRSYNDFAQKQPTAVREGVHMSGTFKGEGDWVKFLDADGKDAKVDPEEFWGVTLEGVLFRTALEHKMRYAAVHPMGENLIYYYSGPSDMRLIVNKETSAYWEGWKPDGLHGLLDDKYYLGARLDGPIIFFADGMKSYKEVFGRYFKEEAIERFRKSTVSARSDKDRYDALMELLKSPK